MQEDVYVSVVFINEDRTIDEPMQFESALILAKDLNGRMLIAQNGSFDLEDWLEYAKTIDILKIHVIGIICDELRE